MVGAYPIDPEEEPIENVYAIDRAQLNKFMFLDSEAWLTFRRRDDAGAQEACSDGRGGHTACEPPQDGPATGV
jgi:hypothetical protein